MSTSERVTSKDFYTRLNDYKRDKIDLLKILQEEETDFRINLNVFPAYMVM